MILTLLERACAQEKATPVEEENSSASVMNLLDAGTGTRSNTAISVRKRSVDTLQIFHFLSHPPAKGKDFFILSKKVL
jgi:hypothetical protein